MKNSFLHYFENRVQIKVVGKNIERFIKRLVSLNIELYDIKYKKYNEVNLVIQKSELERVLEVKTIYEVETIRIYGMSRFQWILKKNSYLLFSLFVGIVLFFFLTHTIFEIEIVHTDKNLRTLLTEELSKNGLAIGKQKKTYEEIQMIKNKILNQYKDMIEWLEIENIGTKYIVRVEERLLHPEDDPTRNQDIVAKKSAILLKIEAENGEIVKHVNDYVRAGDTIISGSIMLNEELKKQIPAQGKIYGEVWYQTTIEYPLDYLEEQKTGKTNTVLTFRFLNKRFELFNFNHYKHKKIKSETILKHNVFPFSLVKEKQEELYVIEEHYTKEEAIQKAIETATEKMKSKLGKKDEILRVQQLKVQENESTIVLELFFTVMEDITATRPIELPKEE